MLNNEKLDFYKKRALLLLNQRFEKSKKTFTFNPQNSDLTPFFREFQQKKHRYNEISGGRSSTKTRETALLFVEDSMLKELSNTTFLCLREFATSLKKSTYKTIKKAIRYKNWEQHFKFIPSNSMILNKITGVEFHFSGCQDPDGLRSVEDASRVWFEESHMLDYKTIQDICNSCRWNDQKGNKTKIFFTYNPEKAVDDVRKYCSTRKNLLHKHITILDVPKNYQNEDMMMSLNEDKLNDFELFEWVWLGKPSPDSPKMLFENIITDDSANYNIKSCVAWLDPSFIGGDTTALTLFVIGAGKVYIKGYVFKRGWKDCMDEVVHILSNNNCKNFSYEGNGIFDGIQEYLKEKYQIHADWEVSKQRKIFRIAKINRFLNKFVFLTEKNSYNRAYMQQLKLYNFKITTHPKAGEYDDAPDSLCTGAKFFRIID